MRNEGIGYSSSFSFDEAFKAALEDVGLPKTPSKPGDVGRAKVIVKEAGAELHWGGIAHGKNNRVYVRVLVEPSDQVKE